jgi:hypothetical protein
VNKNKGGRGGIKRLKRWVWGMRLSMAALYTCFLNEVGNCAAQLGIMWICIVTFPSGSLRCETYQQPGSEKGQGRAGKQNKTNKTKQGETQRSTSHITAASHHNINMQRRPLMKVDGLVCCQNHWLAVWLSGNRTLLLALLRVTSHRDNTESCMAWVRLVILCTWGQRTQVK